jgi:hypothetical protein
MAIGITLLSDDKKDVITRYKELIIMRRAHWSNRPFFFYSAGCLYDGYLFNFLDSNPDYQLEKKN